MCSRLLAILLLSFTLGACDLASDGESREVAPSGFEAEGYSDQPLTQIRFPQGEYVQLFYEDTRVQRNVLAGPRLTPDQRRQLETAVRYRKVDPDEAFPDCFVPHHWFRYFDRDGKQTGEVAVCFCCFDASVSGEGVPNPKLGEVVDADYGKLQGLVRGLGVPTDIACIE